MRRFALEEEKIQKRIEDEDRELWVEFFDKWDTIATPSKQNSLGDAVREVIKMFEKKEVVPSQVIYATAGACFICSAKIPLPEPPGKKLIFTDVLCEACNKSVW